MNDLCILLRLAKLRESACNLCVHRLCKGLVLGPNSRKEDLERCTQISCPTRSGIWGSVNVIKLEEADKRGEELVDVAPH